MTSEEKFPNAHPLKEHLERDGMWWTLGQILGVRISEERLRRYVNGIEPIPHTIKQDFDWFYNTFYNEESPLYRRKNNEGSLRLLFLIKIENKHNILKYYSFISFVCFVYDVDEKFGG